jgi:hypothetical protein
MTFAGWAQIVIFLAVLTALTPLVGERRSFQPQGFAAGPADLSFNTASSFVSNTSWQYYAGETTLTYFSQMLGITVASLTSCAVGMAGGGGVDPRPGQAGDATAAASSTRTPRIPSRTPPV